MTTKSIIAIAALLLASLITVSACANNIGGRDVWHYRMTVTIETPEGDKTGSSVREVTGAPNLKLTPESCGYCVGLSMGEAVVIELGKRGVMFALLSGYREGISYGYNVFFRKHQEDNNFKKITLNLQDYPVFVGFKDLKNPKTVKKFINVSCEGYVTVECVVSKPNEDLFGAGVRIKSVTIERTEDAVTKQITQYLPWIDAQKRIPGSIGGLPGKPFEDPTGTFLTAADFTQGDR